MRAAGNVYVITGPVFDGISPTIGFNRVRAHWLDNTEPARAEKPISYDELVRRTGIQFLPGDFAKQSAFLQSPANGEAAN